eukprot:COSAG01_NODE_625_length_14726_cov_9.023997_10_plen_197_part_00
MRAAWLHRCSALTKCGVPCAADGVGRQVWLDQFLLGLDNASYMAALQTVEGVGEAAAAAARGDTADYNGAPYYKEAAELFSDSPLSSLDSDRPGDGSESSSEKFAQQKADGTKRRSDHEVSDDHGPSKVVAAEEEEGEEEEDLWDLAQEAFERLLIPPAGSLFSTWVHFSVEAYLWIGPVDSRSGLHADDDPLNLL